MRTISRHHSDTANPSLGAFDGLATFLTALLLCCPMAPAQAALYSPRIVSPHNADTYSLKTFAEFERWRDLAGDVKVYEVFNGDLDTAADDREASVVKLDAAGVSLSLSLDNGLSWQALTVTDGNLVLTPQVSGRYGYLLKLVNHFVNAAAGNLHLLPPHPRRLSGLPEDANAAEAVDGVTDDIDRQPRGRRTVLGADDPR